MSDELVNRLRTDATTRQLCELAAAELTALRAKVEQMTRDEAELRRVYEAEIDSASRAAQRQIDDALTERNLARQDAETAIATITALRAKVKRQEDALKPFAYIGRKKIKPDWDDDAPVPERILNEGTCVEDFRRAAQEATDE